MKNKKVLICLALLICCVMATTGTIAYLQDTDSDINVMVLGNVKIDQIELERIEKSESAADNAQNFKPFEQNKMLIPAVGTDANGNIPYAVDENGEIVYQQFPYGGSMQLFDDSGKNVVDKFVFVKNTGNSNAYVRTLIAFEGDSVGGNDAALIHHCYNGNFWDEAPLGQFILNGSVFSVYEYIYKRDDGAGVGVLKPGETTRPSLLQVYMASRATNEDVVNVDANKNGTYDILVLSQAVQADGFADAATALNTAFGDLIDANDAETVKLIEAWLGGEDMEVHAYAQNAEELANAIAANAPYIELLDDITLPTDWVPYGDVNADIWFTGTLDGNGHTVTMDLDTTGKTNTYTALIGAVKGGTVKDLVVEGSVTGNNYTASVVGYMDGGTIENVVNNATISGRRAAGIGSWILNANVTNCVNTGDITAADRAAGICGNLSGTMTGCKNTGDVYNTGSMPAGGMVAVLSGDAYFYNCINTGDVTATASGDNASAAGILGQTPSAKANISYCVNTGDITAASHAAGIAYSLYGNDTASYCYNSGAISGTKTAGGIAPKPAYGSNSNANYCLNDGAVSGGKVYNTANKHTESFYYAGGALYDCDGAAADVNDALTILNGGTDSSFFHIAGGKIESTLK